MTDMTDTGSSALAPSRDGAAANGAVRLSIPAEARFLRLARLTAAGLAGDLGYSVDDIEDLRIAVDELCAAVIEDADPTSELTVSYREHDGALVVEGICDDVRAPLPELHAVAQELLAMLADEYAVASDANGRTFRLVKRSRADR
jgi:serine/threonine-protein kinase RsbW